MDGHFTETAGENYYIIEEGCNGRTTCFEDPFKPNKNGALALPICLETHRPLDLVILCLGTNDLKTRYHLSSNDIARGMGTLVKMTQDYEYGKNFTPPKILVMSPVRMSAGVENQPIYSFGKDSVVISEELPSVYQEIANIYHCFFFDAGAVAQPSEEDHIHMNKQGHLALANALCTKIKEILGEDEH